MIPVDFPERNQVYHKPKEMTDEDCSHLSVFEGHDDKGFPVLVSCWQLNKEDLEEIQQTGKVWLIITSTIQPPVSLSVQSPFQQE